MTNSRQEKEAARIAAGNGAAWLTDRPLEIMRFTALPPPPPQPMTAKMTHRCGRCGHHSRWSSTAEHEIHNQEAGTGQGQT
jgi:hypothetical protein